MLFTYRKKSNEAIDIATNYFLILSLGIHKTSITSMEAVRGVVDDGFQINSLSFRLLFNWLLWYNNNKLPKKTVKYLINW